MTHTYNTKISIITTCYCIFPVPGKKEKHKLKQSEIGVEMVMKIKKHNLC